MAPRALSYSEALASLKERFASKWKLNPETGCWDWTACIGSHGYGLIWNAIVGRQEHAHRVSHLLHKGQIPEGLHIDHLCRRRCCVNPDHLEAVTQDVNNERVPDNIADRQRAKTHCPSGHPYDELNTYWLKGGRRDCRECRNKAARDRRARNSKASGFVPRKERTHCPRGHEYNEINTFKASDGHRSCRACMREGARLKHGYKTRHRSKYQE